MRVGAFPAARTAAPPAVDEYAGPSARVDGLTGNVAWIESTRRGKRNAVTPHDRHAENTAAVCNLQPRTRSVYKERAASTGTPPLAQREISRNADVRYERTVHAFADAFNVGTRTNIVDPRAPLDRVRRLGHRGAKARFLTCHKADAPNNAVVFNEPERLPPKRETFDEHGKFNRLVFDDAAIGQDQSKTTDFVQADGMFRRRIVDRDIRRPNRARAVGTIRLCTIGPRSEQRAHKGKCTQHSHGIQIRSGEVNAF